MKICPQCQTEYDDSKKFCRHDGKLLEVQEAAAGTAITDDVTCPQCGKIVEPGKAFCRYCGARLGSEAQPPTTEVASSHAEDQCPSCGTPVTPGQKFCRVCGTKLALTSSLTEVTPGPQHQSASEREAQALLHWVAERRRGRHDALRTGTKNIGLGAAVILLVVGGFLGYRKVQEWRESPAPPMEQFTTVNEDLEVLSQKELPNPPSSAAAATTQALRESPLTREPAPSGATSLQEESLPTEANFNDAEQKQLATIPPEERKTRASPRPAIISNKGQEYVRQMISSALVEGGINAEADILAAKHRLEALNLKSRVPQGDRKQARVFNNIGLRDVQNWQFTDAVQAFQNAHQADPADVEIINNLGHAYMKNGDMEEAEQFLTEALMFTPGRPNAWADLGQLYARQGNQTAAVACFANAYRFSSKKESTREFFRRLVRDGQDTEKEAAGQTLQLQLVQNNNAVPTGSPAKAPIVNEPPLPPGRYEVVQATPVLQQPRDSATVLARLSPGKKINVVGGTGNYARVESLHGRPPGYILRNAIAPAHREAAE